MTTAPTPTLARWFEYMDSDDPDRVLGMIADDFVMSVQFSKGAGSPPNSSGTGPASSATSHSGRRARWSTTSMSA